MIIEPSKAVNKSSHPSIHVQRVNKQPDFAEKTMAPSTYTNDRPPSSFTGGMHTPNTVVLILFTIFLQANNRD